jgi:hypothetical protein
MNNEKEMVRQLADRCDASGDEQNAPQKEQHFPSLGILSGVPAKTVESMFCGRDHETTPKVKKGAVPEWEAPIGMKKGDQQCGRHKD